MKQNKIWISDSKEKKRLGKYFKKKTYDKTNLMESNVPMTK